MPQRTQRNEETQFDDLSFEKQKELFFKSAYAERGDLLLRSQDPEALAKVLSSEEMYLMTRDMDSDMKSEILKYANRPQLLFLSDMDCWKKDRISKKGFLEWVRSLEQAELEKLAEWLMYADYEMIIASLKKFVTVLKPEWEYAADEVLGDNPYFTLDGLYYIQTQEDNLETVRLVFEVLYQYARAEYVNVVEGLLSELEDEMEEAAYRRRQTRLSERGFPELESALQIYRRLSEEEFQKSPLKRMELSSNGKSENEIPQYPVLAGRERLFLDDVLLALASEPVEVLHSIQEELVWLTNKVLASWGISLASEEKLRSGIEKVRRFVNMGLEAASQSKVDQAKKLVKERWLEFLFRRGFTHWLDLRSGLEEIVRRYWKAGPAELLDFLGEPYENICRDLLNTKLAASDSDRVKDLNQIREIEKFLTALDQFLSAASRLQPKIFDVLALSGQSGNNEITLIQLAGTLFARFSLTGKFLFRELSRKELAQFFETTFEKHEGKYLLKARLVSDFIAGFSNGRAREDLESFLHQILTRVEEDFSGLSGARALDPRFIATIKVK